MRPETLLINQVQARELKSAIVPARHFIRSAVIQALRHAPDISILMETGGLWLVGRSQTRLTGQDYTTVLYTPEDKGVNPLNRSLGLLAASGIPIITADATEPTNAVLITLQGHISNEDVHDTLYDGLKSICCNFRVLGSYPVYH